MVRSYSYWNSSQSSHFTNIMSIDGSCGNGLQKVKSKTRQEALPKVFKEDKFQLLFHLLSEQYHSNEKLCHFLNVLSFHWPPLWRFYYYRNIVSMACISKGICNFYLVICDLIISKFWNSQTELIESWNAKELFPSKNFSLTKTFNSIDLSCSDKYN